MQRIDLKALFKLPGSISALCLLLFSHIAIAETVTHPAIISADTPRSVSGIHATENVTITHSGTISSNTAVGGRRYAYYGPDWWVIPVGTQLPKEFTVTKDKTNRALEDTHESVWKQKLLDPESDTAVEASNDLMLYQNILEKINDREDV